MKTMTSNLVLDSTKLVKNTDASFVRYLNEFISSELVLIQACNSNTKEKDRFLVFKNAFSKVTTLS